jgi:predicted amino acid dehydrogenase
MPQVIVCEPTLAMGVLRGMLGGAALFAEASVLAAAVVAVLFSALAVALCLCEALEPQEARSPLVLRRSSAPAREALKWALVE